MTNSFKSKFSVFLRAKKCFDVTSIADSITEIVAMRQTK